MYNRYDGLLIDDCSKWFSYATTFYSSTTQLTLMCNTCMKVYLIQIRQENIDMNIRVRGIQS